MLKHTVKTLFRRFVADQPVKPTIAEQQRRHWVEQCRTYNAQIAAESALNDRVIDAYEVRTVTDKNILELLCLSALTIDRTDLALGKISQLEHSLQLAARLESSGPEFVTAALLHDLGKSAGAFHPEYALHILGAAKWLSGSSKDSLVLRYSHAEWAYLRFKPLVSNGAAELIRYHNVCPTGLRILAEGDPTLAEQIQHFREAEVHSKGQYAESLTHERAVQLLSPIMGATRFPI